jgi:hypothetical protein
VKLRRRKGGQVEVEVFSGLSGPFRGGSRARHENNPAWRGLLEGDWKSWEAEEERRQSMEPTS